MKRAKKLLSLLIAAILLVSLSSCGGSKGGGENEAALGKYNALTYSFGINFGCNWKLVGT